MPSRYVRIPHRLAVEPLEVLFNQTLGRILTTPQDSRSWEDQAEKPEPDVLAGTWYHYDLEEARAFDLRAGDVVEVDLDVDLNSYILMLAAIRKGYQDLAAALAADDKDLAENLLCQLENV
jgi:hypothetical protein